MRLGNACAKNRLKKMSDIYNENVTQNIYISGPRTFTRRRVVSILFLVLYDHKSHSFV